MEKIIAMLAIGEPRMNQEDQMTILLIKGAISELPPTDCEQCKRLAEQLRRMVEDAGTKVGHMALALVAAELQAKGDQSSES